MKACIKLFFLLYFFSSFCLYAEDNRLQKIDGKLQKEVEKGKIGYDSRDYELLQRVKKELESITKDGLLDKVNFLKSKEELTESRNDAAKNFLNSYDSEETTPLMYAVQFNDADAVKEMLEYGADPNKKAGDNRTALFYAFELADEKASENQNEKDKVLKIINLLLSYNADVNYSFNSINSKIKSNTPLMAACVIPEGNDKRFKQTIIEKILYSNNLRNIDELSCYENLCLTPLAYLCILGNLDDDVKYKYYVSYLLSRNADVNKIIKIEGFEGKIVQYLCANYTRSNLKLIQELIEKGADIDSSFACNGETVIPLICAVRSKDNEFIDLIIDSLKKKDDARRKYQTKDADGTYWTCSAFHIVAKNGNKELYKKFKENGIDNKERDSRDKLAIEYLRQTVKTPVDEIFLVYEIDKNDVDNDIDNVIESLKKNEKLDVKTAKTSDGMTLLQVILLNKDEDRAIQLLNYFGKENIKHIFSDQNTDNNNKNAFDYAIDYNCKEVIKWFVDNHIAVGNSIFSIIDKILLSQDERLLAALESFLRIESDNNILRKRFNYNDKGYIEAPLIAYTIMMNNDNSKTQMKLKIIEKLLENEADIDACVSKNLENGNSALIYAIKNNNEEIAKFLIEKNINLDLSSEPTVGGDDAGKTAIFYALEKRMDTIVECILKKKNMILDDKIITNGNSLLMYFAKYSNARILRALLPYYVQTNNNCMKKRDPEGLTPFLYAIAFNESIEVARLLRMYGADVNVTNKDGYNAVRLVKNNSSLEDKDSRIGRLESWGVK